MAANAPPALSNAPGGRWLLLALLSLGGFTTALNVTLLSPLLVDIAAEFDVSEAAAGQLATLTALSSGVMAVTVAPWMDRYPRSFWLRLECSLLIVGTLLSALAPVFALMFIGRVIAGIGGAVIGANCLAATGDLFPDKTERNRAIGLINSSFTLGAVFGLPLVTLLADWTDWRWAISLPAPLAALVLLGVTRLPKGVQTQAGSLWQAWVSGYGRVLRNRETVLLLLAEIGFMLVWFGWLIYFGAFTETVYLVSATMLSILFLVGGGAEMIGNNVAPLLLRTRSVRTVGTVAVAILTLNLLAVGVIYTERWMLFPFIAIGAGMSAVLFMTVNIALLDSMPSEPGAVMSLQSASLELGGAVGVAITGLALATLDDYEATFRLLGLLMPIVAVFLMMSAKARARTLGSAPEDGVIREAANVDAETRPV